jgi:hypothetical protein
MTKDDLIRKHSFNCDQQGEVIPGIRAEEIMDEYAQQQCIEYMDWVLTKMMPHLTKNSTSEQAKNLYNQFLQQQNK